MSNSEQTSVAAEVVAELERIERDAWADIYAAAPDDIRNALGVSHRVFAAQPAAGTIK